jgi:hypothetical protein
MASRDSVGTAPNIIADNGAHARRSPVLATVF